MTVYYSKGGADLAQMIGFGVTRPSRAPHRIELADVGMFYAYREGALRDKPVLAIPIEELQLRASTRQVMTGGGWVGGGVGLTGAMLGVMQAKALNALTTRTDELVVLTVGQYLATGARRSALLTFRRTSEAALRDELLPAFRAWVDAYVSAMVANRPDGPCLDGALDQQYATFDAMHARKIINDHDARVLKSNASRPFIAALVAQIQSGQVARHDVQRIITQINDMHRAGEISTRQAQHVRALADPILNQPPPAQPQRSPGMDDATRIELLETLARLRSTGALTENEYQAETTPPGPLTLQRRRHSAQSAASEEDT